VEGKQAVRNILTYLRKL